MVETSDFQALKFSTSLYDKANIVNMVVLICVFRGGRWGCASPNRSKFLQRVYSAAPSVDWTATAEEQRQDTATAAISSCSSVKFPNVYRVYRLLTILGTLPVTTRESERVSDNKQFTRIKNQNIK